MKIKSALLLLTTLGTFSAASAQTGPSVDQTTPRSPGSSSVPSTSTTGPGINEESSGAIRGRDNRSGTFNPADTDTQNQPTKSKRGTQPLPSDSTNEKDTGSGSTDPLSGPGPQGP